MLVTFDLGIFSRSMSICFEAIDALYDIYNC